MKKPEEEKMIKQLFSRVNLMIDKRFLVMLGTKRTSDKGKG
jgi:hypothetical protein